MPRTTTSRRRPPALSPPREAEVLAQCLRWLNLVGCLAWRANSGACAFGEGKSRRFVRFNSAPGCADILGVLPGGRALAIETKRPRGAPTPKQAAFLAQVHRVGGLALVVHSLEELAAALRRAGYHFPEVR